MSETAEVTALASRVGALYERRFGGPRDALFHIGRLSEELGELTEAVMQAEGRGRPKALPETAIADEAADMLGFLLLLAEWKGFDLFEAFERKWGAYDA